jgi:hypothetical protein
MYKRMDKLVAFISKEYLFLVMPDSAPKYAAISNNQQQYDILMKCEDATKEEFEALLKTKDFNQASFEAFYWANNHQ